MMRHIWMRLLPIILGIGVTLGTMTTPALAHALPTSYAPAQNAVLSVPPSTVQIHFSEQLNSDASKITVVNPSNQEVDNKDTRISGDQLTMTVSLPLLAAGTYVVAWRSHSADDGHVAAGSYIFHIARADGTVPALTGPLPTGGIVGGAGTAPSNGLDGPNFIGALARWIGLVAVTLFLGMIFWWRFVMPRQTTLSPTLRATLMHRFAQAGDLALETIFAATIVEVAIQALILDGSWRGIFSTKLLADILFTSRFGQFIVLRLALVIIGLACLWIGVLRTSLTVRNQRLIVPFFGIILAIAFVYSGHGGAAPNWYGPLVDFIHLISESIWLGGLLVLALLIVAALQEGSAQEQWQFLATALPSFSIPALASVIIISVTGPLNAAGRMTSFSQLWTTGYGIVLSVKIALFLLMAAISYVHAFRVRPQLAAAIGNATPQPAGNRMLNRLLLAFENRQQLTVQPNSGGSVALSSAQELTTTPQSLADRIVLLFKIEAGIGVAVLLCAALLGPLAASLAPTVISSSSFGATGGNQSYTQVIDTYRVTLAVNPGRFGTNTFTVVVANPDGSPASGSSIFLLSNMVEMDMGENTINLTPTSNPGTYAGQGELPMAGHWRMTVVLRSAIDPNNLHRVTITVSASF